MTLLNDLHDREENWEKGKEEKFIKDSMFKKIKRKSEQNAE